MALAIERRLRAIGTAERARWEKRYLKSELEHFGVTVPALRRVAMEVTREQPELGRQEALALVRRLWSRPVHEMRMVAVELLDLHSGRLQARDIAVIERFIREAKTWALVDGLAATVAGALVKRLPRLGSTLDRWASDDDFWVRRAALLVLLPQVRAGSKRPLARLGRFSDRMLDEKEFFIRKAIGWVLRETGRRNPAWVHAYVAPRIGRMSGLTFLEAIKYLPASQRARLWRLRARPPSRRKPSSRQ